MLELLLPVRVTIAWSHCPALRRGARPEELRSGAEATQGGKEPGASAIIVKAGQAANTARLDTGGPFDPVERAWVRGSRTGL
jgi:hypothetical protein